MNLRCHNAASAAPRARATAGGGPRTGGGAGGGGGGGRGGSWESMIKRGNRESKGAYQIVYIAPGLVAIPSISAAGVVRGGSGGGDRGGGGSYGEYERSKTIEPTAQHML